MLESASECARTGRWLADAEWLEARRKVLTATDAAAILGVHPWKSALQVYVEKVQGVELTQPNRRMRLGQRFEDDIAEEYAEETGRRVAPPAERLTVHPHLPWMAASLDRLVDDPHKGRGVLEVKAIWHRLPEDRSLMMVDDEARTSKPCWPAHWLVQLAQQMEVAQLPWGSLAALEYGERLIWDDVAPDDRFRTLLLDRLEEFWQRLQRRQPPDPDGSDSAAKALRALYPRATESTVTLPPESAEWARAYVEASEEISRLTKVKSEAQNRIVAAMGEASIGLAADGTRFTYRLEHRKATTTAAKDIRVFRRAR